MPTKRYIKLILPLRLEWEPCYLLTADVRPGQRGVVRFAGRRIVGVVSEVDVTPDIDESRIQPVLTVESGLDPISPEEISLWRHNICFINYPQPVTYNFRFHYK